jgi:P-type Ca2+ transporter type 2C
VTIGAVAIAFVTSLASDDGQSVLSVVPLLWINLIQDTFAALALATDPPTLSLLERKPAPRASIISGNMWKMMLGQAILQIIVVLVLNFAGLRIFTYWSQLELKTVVFNTFAWLQISNQMNCRRIDDKVNVFAGLHRNWLFIAITFLTICGQVIIINVGGEAFSVTRLNGLQWAVSLVLGMLSLPVGLCIRLIPNRWFQSLPAKRLRRRSRNAPVRNAGREALDAHRSSDTTGPEEEPA